MTHNAFPSAATHRAEPVPDNRPPEQEALAARRQFPRGLFQPPGSFRFAMDSLLLAAFLAPDPARPAVLLDLGTGCGVVALAMLLRHPNLTAVGVEKQDNLAEAARENARRLGLAGRFQVIRADLSTVSPGPADLVLANPPYRVTGHGRPPRDASRREALFADKDALARFCHAAARAMAPHSRFGAVFPAPALARLMRALGAAGLFAVRLLPVHARQDAPALLVLVEAALGGLGAPRRDPPLILHRGQGENTRLTDGALAFCPELDKGKKEKNEEDPP